MEPQIKVTRIKNRWHARLIYKGKVLDEMACAERRDIGWICREVLRWFEKLGGCSQFASSARKRQCSNPIGRIWWRGQLGEDGKVRRLGDGKIFRRRNILLSEGLQ